MISTRVPSPCAISPIPGVSEGTAVGSVMVGVGAVKRARPKLEKPVLVMRKETERPEAVAAGTVKLAGVEFSLRWQVTTITFWFS